MSYSLKRIAIALALLLASAAHAQTSCQKIGNMTYCSDGSTAHSIGNMEYYSPARPGMPNSSQDIGNMRYYDNGVTRQRIGNMDYFSNGTTCQRIGNMTYCN